MTIKTIQSTFTMPNVHHLFLFIVYTIKLFTLLNYLIKNNMQSSLISGHLYINELLHPV